MTTELVAHAVLLPDVGIGHNCRKALVILAESAVLVRVPTCTIELPIVTFAVAAGELELLVVTLAGVEGVQLGMLVQRALSLITSVQT